MHLIVVPLEGRSGELDRATQCLADVEVDGFSIGGDRARLLVHDGDGVLAALHGAGFGGEAHPVAAVRTDGPTEDLCERLGALGIELELHFGPMRGAAYIRLADLEKATPVLTEHGATVLHRA